MWYGSGSVGSVEYQISIIEEEQSCKFNDNNTPHIPHINMLYDINSQLDQRYTHLALCDSDEILFRYQAAPAVVLQLEINVYNYLKEGKYEYDGCLFGMLVLLYDDDVIDRRRSAWLTSAPLHIIRV